MKQFVLLTVLAASAGLGTVWAGANIWTSLGPDGGGANALVIDPLTPSTVYAVTYAGLFKSTDGGASWNVTTPLPPSSGAITSLTLDPQNSGTLYAATRESSSSEPGNWVFKSTDGGASWRALKSGLLFGLSGPLAIDPQNPNLIYAGGYNDIFKSTDGGETWKMTSSGLPSSCCIIVRGLVIDALNSSRLYAVTGLGIFKSTDRGASWSAVYKYSGLFTDPQFGTLAMDPQDPSTLYGLRYGFGGVFKSTDGGASWSEANSGLPTPPSGPFIISALAIDLRNTRTVYVATGFGVFKSTDGGSNWNAANFGLTSTSAGALAIDPQNPNIVFASSNDPRQSAVYKSTDGAASWSAINSGLRAITIYRLTIDPQNPATLYASGPGGGFKSTDGGTSWNQVDSPDLLAVDPQNPATRFGAGPGGLSKTTDGGANWSPANDGLPQGFCHGVTSVAIDPQNRSTVYAGVSSSPCSGTRTGGVWKSSDGGASWEKLEAQPDGGGIYGLAIDPQNSSTVYAWNGMGPFKSLDGGASWSRLRARGPVNILAIDPQSPNTLYVVNNDSCTPCEQPGVSKSTDGGASWSAVNSGLPTFYLPNGFQVNTVSRLVIDPHHTATVYAGTRAYGVFKTTDGGASWSPVNPGLPSLSVFDLAMDPQNTNRLYAGTAGGVFTITQEQ